TLAEGIDLEGDAAAVGTADLLLLEVDGDDGVCASFGVVHQLVDLALRKLNRQDAVLEAVVVEDIGEAGRDDTSYAEIQQRPGRVLAAGPATEICTGYEDRGLAIGRAIENEVGLFLAVRRVAHLVEQVLAEAGALDRLEELLGDDLVGVDIDHRQRRRDASKR